MFKFTSEKGGRTARVAAQNPIRGSQKEDQKPRVRRSGPSTALNETRSAMLAARGAGGEGGQLQDFEIESAHLGKGLKNLGSSSQGLSFNPCDPAGNSRR
jgi:hypothetical protein